MACGKKDRTTSEKTAPEKTANASNDEHVTPDSKTSAATPDPSSAGAKREVGGPKGPEPTRYGDWEKGGRCSDF